MITEGRTQHARCGFCAGRHLYALAQELSEISLQQNGKKLRVKWTFSSINIQTE